MPFKNCCFLPNVISYSIKHGTFSSSEKTLLTNLLWYLPEVESSEQSITGTLLSDSTYDYYFVDILKKTLSLGPDDYEINTSSQTIPNSTATWFVSNLCLNCSKLYVGIKRGKTHIATIFTRIRNMIAHGRFNIINNVFIGFDMNGSNYTGLLKTSIGSLYTLFERFSFVNSKMHPEDIYKDLLGRFGYEVFLASYKPIDNGYGLVAKRDGIEYFLEFKEMHGRYIDTSVIMKHISNQDIFQTKHRIYALVVDSSYLTKNAYKMLEEKNVHLIDKQQVKRLVDGIDVLSEIYLKTNF